jgi:hypothetical protein
MIFEGDGAWSGPGSEEDAAGSEEDAVSFSRPRETTEALVADCLAGEPEWSRLLDLVDSDLEESGELSL